MTMAIDYMIGTLIAVSALVNALALGAFWVTPGLRTTANRFVINLLIVNLVGCAALTPSLFGSSSSSNSSSTSSIGSSFNHIGIDGPVFPAQPQQLRIFNASNETSLVDLALAEVLAVETAAMELVSEATAADSVVKAMEVVASIAVETESAILGTDDDDNADEFMALNERQQQQQQQTPRRESAAFWGNTRHWGFDLTAALGE